jgi:hypothetical protein
MATERGMHFGTQLVFTFGPLGFLSIPELWYRGLAAVAFAFQGALHFLLCVTLVYSLRRHVGLVLATVAGFVVLTVASSAEVATVLAAAWCITALEREPPSFAVWLVAIGGGILGAVETLIEVRPGPLVIAMCLITLLFLDGRRRYLPLFFGCLLVVGAALWFASGQSTGNIGPFVSNEFQIVSGYSEAMGTASGGTRLWLALVISLAVVAWAASAAGPDRRRRIGAGVVVAVVCFALFKEAFVRGDVYHSPTFFAGALVLAAAAGLFVPRRSRWGLAALAALIVINVEVVHVSLSTFNPVTYAKNGVNQVRLLASSRRLARVRFFASAVWTARFGIPPRALAMLRGHTVHLDPWDTAAAYFYGLDWDPLPVFQNYSAYTTALDQLNVRKLQSATAPQMVLRENTRLVDVFHRDAGLDGRVGVWDPPAQTLAMMCHYVPTYTAARWQVLTRVANRCGTAQRIASISASPGQTVVVPPVGRGEALYARVHGLGVSGFEKIEALLYRAHVRDAVINGTRQVRLVPGTATDGLLFDLSAEVDYPAPFALSPKVHTVSFTGRGVRIDLYRLPVSPVRR